MWHQVIRMSSLVNGTVWITWHAERTPRHDVTADGFRGSQVVMNITRLGATETRCVSRGLICFSLVLLIQETDGIKSRTSVAAKDVHDRCSPRRR
jgi:hypothetical protein